MKESTQKFAACERIALHYRCHYYSQSYQLLGILCRAIAFSIDFHFSAFPFKYFHLLAFNRIPSFSHWRHLILYIKWS